MATINASWSISLHTDCPYCLEGVDLLDYPDFWDGEDFGVGEHMTAKTKNVEVVCPECLDSFKVDFQY